MLWAENVKCLIVCLCKCVNKWTFENLYVFVHVHVSLNPKCRWVKGLCLWGAIVQCWPIMHSCFIKCAFYFSTTWPDALLTTHYLSQKAHRQSHSKVIHYGIANTPLYCDEKPGMKNRGLIPSEELAAVQGVQATDDNISDIY